MQGAVQGFICVPILVMVNEMPSEQHSSSTYFLGCAVEGKPDLPSAIAGALTHDVHTHSHTHADSLAPTLEQGGGIWATVSGHPELSALPVDFCSGTDRVIKLRKEHLQKNGELEKLRKKRHLDFLDILLFARVSVCRRA